MSSPLPIAASSDASLAPTPWTCPFCALLCDGFELSAQDGRYALKGSDCARAAKALVHFQRGAASPASPRIAGQAATLAQAIEAAAQQLAGSHQPLFGGLATDVNGARALYPLACATGAIYDAAGGAYQMHSLRALQDRGAFTTTFAEVRNRAELIVCIGSDPRGNYPEIWRRLGLGEDLVAQREVAFVGAPVDADLAAMPRTQTTAIGLQGDLFDTVALLTALVAQRRVAAPDDLAALADRLRASRYSAIVWEPSKLPAQGALIIEALNALVGTLNRKTRAGGLPLSGNDGLAAVNYTFSWLSGVPLRSRAGPLGLEHEPQAFDAQRLLQDGSVDSLLWISSYGPEPAVPTTAMANKLPTVVLGHPATVAPPHAVFIPVATPGIGAVGDLFRADGGITLPLAAVQDDGLPALPDVLKALTARVNELKPRPIAPAPQKQGAAA